MKKFLALTAVMAFIVGAVPVMAQATYTDSNGDEYEFNRHWFINLYGGVQYTHDTDGKFTDLLSPNVQIGVGYQFTPVFSMRLQANSWRSKGGWDEYGSENYSNTYKYTYIAPGVDFSFNLSNAICGWNPNRVFNFSAFFGLGANIAWDNDEANAIYNSISVGDANSYVLGSLDNLWDGTKVRAFGRVGFDIDFRVCDAVSIGIEGNANVTTDKYNSKEKGNPDWYFDLLAGLRINLGKTYTKKEKPVQPAPKPAPKPVEQPKAQPAPPAKPAAKAEPKPEVKPQPIRRDIFFSINTSTITESEQVKIDEVAKYMNDNPKAKVKVTGFSDAGTGTDAINDKLAAKRAATAVEALKAKGVDGSRITSDSKGSREQPFSENDKNRVAIVVAE